MATSVRLNWGRVIMQGVCAGIVAGAVLDVYLYLTAIVPAHGSIIAMWQWVASAAIGPVALTNPSYAWLGFVVHFIVSIAWAGGYASFAQTQNFVNTRWLISGLMYGLIVYVFMQILLLGAHAFVWPPTPAAFVNQILAHMLFFGVPVAYVVARMDQA
jgi:uncharacterized membrane protein YagU involved in acid resistance